MAFQLAHYSQQDPQWKNIKIGSSSETIGRVGCALTSVAMLLSGYGYGETPASLNKKLKQNGGFMGAAIVWGTVSVVRPQVKFENIVICRDSDAPLSAINASLAAGQPVLVEVDNSPAAGLQTHWVVLYAKKGDDYLMLDPWPYPPDDGEVLLTPRFSHGRSLKRSITALVWYECTTEGGTVELPVESGLTLKVSAAAEAGLRLRSQPGVDSDTLAIEAAGTPLAVIEPQAGAEGKIGAYGQWLQVRDAQGREGYVAAWYVEKVEAAAPAAETGAGPGESEAEPEKPPKPKREVRQKLTVVVSQSVGPNGLRLRKKPALDGALLAVEPAGAKLTVLEKAEKARPKIGREGQWLNVRDPQGRRGYVMAQYVGEA